MMQWKRSTETITPYKWGDNCLGWHLLESKDLSVIEEKMPPNTSETLHFHERAQQLFYIISGIASFTIEQEKVEAKAGESIHIPPKTIHQISNLQRTDLHFLVISQPKSHGDRVNLS